VIRMGGCFKTKKKRKKSGEAKEGQGEEGGAKEA
jgi:hypothetical protein